MKRTINMCIAFIDTFLPEYFPFVGSAPSAQQFLPDTSEKVGVN
jgi:hypothetical protein